jgi:glycosyltransferase involved in cell wall biosynthesis
MLSLAQKLKENGYHVIIISSNCDQYKLKPEMAGIVGYSIPIAQRNLYTLVVGIFLILQILLRENVDIIHSHHRWVSFLCYPLSRLLNIPLVTTYHGIHQGKERLSVWGDAVICVSRDAYNHLIGTFNVPSKKAKIVHNGIIVPDYNICTLVNRYHLPTDRYLIGNIARLSKEKDHYTLLRAIALLIDKHNELLLVMAGAGPLENEIKEFIKVHKLGNHVTLLGEIDDITNFILHMNFTVLSSITEGLPLCILESLCLCKPAIATAVGDIPEILSNSQAGILIPPGDSEKLSEAIELLISDKEKLIQMGIAGRKLVETRFSVDKMTEATTGIYHELLTIRNNNLLTDTAAD